MKEPKNGGLWFTWTRKIFINSSLYPYYKMLWSKSKKLLTLGEINSFLVLAAPLESISVKIVLGCQ